MATPIVDLPRCPKCDRADVWMVYLERDGGVCKAIHMFCNECLKEWTIPTTSEATCGQSTES